MKSFFHELFEYNYHVNEKIGNYMLQNKGQISQQACAWYSHILNAHQIWNNRISPKSSLFEVWTTQPIDEFDTINKTNFQQSIEVLRLFDLSTPIHYTNSKGKTFTNTVQHILFHIINHSTHHRGQIATNFRETNHQPIVTDFISYKR